MLGTARIAPGGMIYHVINRGVGKQHLFFSDEDYLAFEKIIERTLDSVLEAIRRSCNRGSPYGRREWIDWAAKELSLEATLRRPDRPKRP